MVGTTISQLLASVAATSIDTTPHDLYRAKRVSRRVMEVLVLRECPNYILE